MRLLIVLFTLSALAAIPFARSADSAPSPSPTASVTPAKKHAKKSKASAEATPAAAANAAAAPSASPSVKKHKAPEPQATQAPGGGKGQVWVNSETHVFHKEGSKWYGRTKQGKYLSEAEAVKEGDKPAKNEKP